MENIECWISGCCYTNLGRQIGGIGVVFNNELGEFYGPVTDNFSSDISTESSELEACALALVTAHTMEYSAIQMHTKSKMIFSLINIWMPAWKSRGWREVDGSKIPFNLRYIQDMDRVLRGMEVTWSWATENNSHANHQRAEHLAMSGCKNVNMNFREHHQYNVLVNTYDPDRILAPTFIRNIDTVVFKQKDDIHCFEVKCKLDLSSDLMNDLVKQDACIQVMSSDRAFGMITTLRTLEKLDNDGSLRVVCHSLHGEKYNPTLVLPAGSIIGVAFTSSPLDAKGWEAKGWECHYGTMFWSSRSKEDKYYVRVDENDEI